MLSAHAHDAHALTVSSCGGEIPNLTGSFRHRAMSGRAESAQPMAACNTEQFQRRARVEARCPQDTLPLS